MTNKQFKGYQGKGGWVESGREPQTARNISLNILLAQLIKIYLALWLFYPGLFSWLVFAIGRHNQVFQEMAAAAAGTQSPD